MVELKSGPWVGRLSDSHTCYVAICDTSPSSLKVPREDMVLCPVRDSLYYDDNKNPVNEYFECPGPEDPPDHNR